MPLPHFVARTNRYWINPIARTIGPRLPPFMLVHHVGRKSGATYTTPIWAFKRPNGFLIVLTYGPRTDWLRNLKAAGTCTATHAGQTWQLSDPRIVHGSSDDQPLAWPVRKVLGLLGVQDFLQVSGTIESKGPNSSTDRQSPT